MEKYHIFNSTTNETYILYIHEIFELIRQHPEYQYYKLVNNESILIHNKTVLNTEFICHRINTEEELRNIPTIFGVELDLRDGDYKQLHLQHDPYFRGECFESYLKSYNHKTMILNIKSERIEPLCIEFMEKYSIKSYFFLDSNLPMIYLLNTKHNNNNIACRFSEFEPIESYRLIKHMIQWVWCDCFTSNFSGKCAYGASTLVSERSSQPCAIESGAEDGLRPSLELRPTCGEKLVFFSTPTCGEVCEKSSQQLTRDIYDEIKKDGTKICIVSPELQGRSQEIQKYRYYFIENNILPDAICCKISNIIYWI